MEGIRDMKCYDCDFYKSGYQWNGCGVTGDEYFHTVLDCTFVNDDQTINEEELNKAFGEPLSE